MKKALILALAGILMVASGVAAVSAYEAHVVNVTAHVENVLTTSIPAGESTEFGTVFPQEWLKAHVRVGLSSSAIAELGTDPGDLGSVNCTLFAEWKLVPTDVNLAAYHMIDTTKYYPWLGEALWVGVGPDDWPDDVIGDPGAAPVEDTPDYVAGDLSWVGPAPVAPAMAVNTGHTFTLPDPVAGNSVLVGVGLDAPVFEGFYNPATDPTPKPSKRDSPSLIIQDDDTERYFPTGDSGDPNYYPAILGLDLKFQVTEIDRR